MESLLTELVLEDFRDRIRLIEIETRDILKYAESMKAFTKYLETVRTLPISTKKYSGKLMYVAWVLRRNQLYLGLNVVYSRKRNFKHVESLSQTGDIVYLTNPRLIKTIDGKKFKPKFDFIYGNVNVVEVGKIFSTSENTKIIEKGVEKFACRDKFLRKYDVQLAENWV